MPWRQEAITARASGWSSGGRTDELIRSTDRCPAAVPPYIGNPHFTCQSLFDELDAGLPRADAIRNMTSCHQPASSARGRRTIWVRGYEWASAIHHFQIMLSMSVNCCCCWINWGLSSRLKRQQSRWPRMHPCALLNVGALGSGGPSNTSKHQSVVSIRLLRNGCNNFLTPSVFHRLSPPLSLLTYRVRGARLHITTSNIYEFRTIWRSPFHYDIGPSRNTWLIVSSHRIASRGTLRSFAAMSWSKPA